MRIGLLAAASLLLLSACEQNNVYVASNTLIGLNAGVNPAQSTGKIFFGYERDFVAIIPKAVDNPPPADTVAAPAGSTTSDAEASGDGQSPSTAAPTAPVVQGVSWKSEQGEGKELMSVLGCTDVQAKGIFIRRFTEYLATGQAARNFAVALRLKDVEQDEVIDQFFKCLKKPVEEASGG